MPSLMIQPTRTEVTRSFPVLGFAIRTGDSPSWFEVAIASDPGLFDAGAKNRRSSSNFYSSRVGGPLLADRGEAVYLVPQAVLNRLAGNERLYYALATYKEPAFRNPHLITPPKEAAPSIFISRSYSGVGRRLSVRPARRGGVNDRDGGYADDRPEALEWGGDEAVAGKDEPIATAPVKPAGAAAAPASPASAAQAADSAYDDGYDPMIWERQLADEATGDDDRGIEGPIPDSGDSTAQALTLTSPEYPQASRFEPAAPGNYRVSSSQRSINRVVIHITDGGRNINGTIGWFKNPAAKVSAHYVVGQDGEVVQMVAHNDVAWHASHANGDSIGIEHVASRARGIMPTEAEYCASAALVTWLCQQLGIPVDRQHILGHSEADPGTTHTGCPNSVWNWDYYMDLVTSGQCKPMPDGAGAAAQSLALEKAVPSRVLVAAAAAPTKELQARLTHLHHPEAKAMAGPVAAVGAAIAGVAINRIEDSKGSVTWHLDQWSGPKWPWDLKQYEGPSVWQHHTTQVDGPWVGTIVGAKEEADFEIEWDSNGSSIRNIVISTTGIKDWMLAGLDVQGRIVDEPNAYTFPPDTTPVAAIHVRFDYHFHLHMQSDKFCITNVTLYGNGTPSFAYDWWK